MGFLANLFGKKPPIERPEISKPETDFNAGLSRLEDLERFRRTCWQPVLEDGDGGAAASKFSGVPYLAEGESWPTCPNCGNPIQLFLQLNSDDLPAESGKPWGDGLLQFFYCTNRKPNCELDNAAWDAFAKSVMIRVVPAGSSPSKFSLSPVTDAFPPKLITGWSALDDLPNPEELESLGLTLSEEDAEEIYENFPRAGEKLLGWPYWVQGVEYPDCPECGSVMRHVFQIDSYGALPFMFGDAGAGHITQCPQHPTTMAFRWACA